MKGKKFYPSYKAGEAVEIDWRRQDFKFQCCDCGLVHRMRFIAAGHRLRFRVWRDSRATGQMRRWRRVRENGRG